MKQEFSAYVPYLDSPAWMPNNGSMEVFVGGSPEDPGEQITKETVDKFSPLLQTFVEGGGKTFKLSSPVSSIDDVLDNPHVMAYTPNAMFVIFFLPGLGTNPLLTHTYCSD